MLKQIQRVNALTKNQFEKTYLNLATPVIVSSGLDWKALTWTPNYFQNLFPEKIVNLEFNYSIPIKGKNLLKSNIIQKVSMEEAIKLIYNNNDPNIKYYLSQQSIYSEFPELIQDIGILPWVDKNLKNGEYTVNLWFGEAGNATPLHYDVSHNLLIQLYGRKHIRLFAPSDTKYLYCHTAQTRGPRYLSQIPDIDNVDNKKYPSFKNAHVYEGIIHPKETIFIPSGWWHDIRSIDHAISINCWWRPKINETILPHLLPLKAFEFYESGRFNEVYNFFSNSNDFKNELEIAHYYINNKYYFLSVLFMINFLVNILKSIAILLNIQVKHENKPENVNDLNQSILHIDERLGIKQADLSRWLDLAFQAKAENNDIFELKDLELMYSKIQDFAKMLKNRIRIDKE